MKRFTQLFRELERTTRTNEKVAALERYFSEAQPEDAAWALQFLTGKSLPRAVSTRNLWHWTASETNMPDWLMRECYEAVGDMAETMALLLPESKSGTRLRLSQLVEERLLPLARLPEQARRESLVKTWRELDPAESLVWNKLITGNFRLGAARTLVVRALAIVAGVEQPIMAHRILGPWLPTAKDFQRLINPDESEVLVAKPYPFYLASPLEMKLKSGESLDVLGSLNDWQVEWKWDGIRAQLIRRGGETLIWSRGDEMVTASFPEIVEAGNALPGGTVLDGEILAWQGDAPRTFAALQRRLGRKSVAAKTRSEFPVVFVAYDLLEWEGIDVRDKPLDERRSRLEEIIAQFGKPVKASSLVKGARSSTLMLPGFENGFDLQESTQPLRISPLVKAKNWEELTILRGEARNRGVEGLMLKRAGSIYGVGRQRGDWWKWKIDPFTVDAVLVAAERGHGRRASLYTDYTFALWRQGQLVPVAKAYSGLTDEEIMKVDSLVRGNTTGKFGPVCSVKPTQVFELAFEGIQRSTRHKSGVAVRFPRISRWRQDKKPEEADTVDFLLKLAETGQLS